MENLLILAHPLPPLPTILICCKPISQNWTRLHTECQPVKHALADAVAPYAVSRAVLVDVAEYTGLTGTHSCTPGTLILG